MELKRDARDPHLLFVEIDEQINQAIDPTADFVVFVDQLLSDGVAFVVLDCRNIRYFTTVGLAAIIKLHKRMIERKTPLKVSGLRGLAKDEIHTLRLDRMLDICETEEQARQAFTQHMASQV